MNNKTSLVSGPNSVCTDFFSDFYKKHPNPMVFRLRLLFFLLSTLLHSTSYTTISAVRLSLSHRHTLQPSSSERDELCFLSAAFEHLFDNVSTGCDDCVNRPKVTTKVGGDGKATKVTVGGPDAPYDAERGMKGAGRLCCSGPECALDCCCLGLRRAGIADQQCCRKYGLDEWTPVLK